MTAIEDQKEAIREAIAVAVEAEAKITPRSCHDCGVEPGEIHWSACDVARCMWTGGQRLSCSGDLLNEIAGVLRGAGHDDLAEDMFDYFDLDNDHDCGNDIWTGLWPGELECREYGLWCTDPRYPPMIPCSPDFPGATEDINRLLKECDWDREQKKWVPRNNFQKKWPVRHGF